MAYTLISSQTLGSSAASVTFSSIPSTYKDLVLRVSSRDAVGASYISNLYFAFNGVGGTSYSQTNLKATSVAASSNRYTNQPNLDSLLQPATTATANTFGSFELYIPSYTASQSKPSSVFGVSENNNYQDYYINNDAYLFSNSSAISSIAITCDNTFATNSSFYLYGIN